MKFGKLPLAGVCVKCVLVFAFVLGLVAVAQAQHPPIMLLDKEGEEINPILGENNKAPFSTEQTCGM